MMTLEDFIAKYNGVPVDFDKAGAQCIDLIRQYMQDVWALPRQPESVASVEDFYFKHENRPIQMQFCDCTLFAGTVRPPVGSIVIFQARNGNKYGHIGICVGATHDSLDVFEQDGAYNAAAIAVGHPQKGASIGKWKYDRLAGWLTKKE